jgi:hypothetical protein
VKKDRWLIISAMLNVVLAGFVIAFSVQKLAPTPPQPADVAATVAEIRREIAPLGAPTAAKIAVETPKIGAEIISPPQISVEFSQLIGRLRAEGVSEEVLGDIASAFFMRQWSEKMRAFQRRVRRGELDPREQSGLWLQMQTEQENALKAVLGEEGYVRWERANVLRWVDFGDVQLSPDEKDAVYRLQKELQRRQVELSRAFQAGEMDPFDNEELRRKYQEEYDQRMIEVLGAERYAQFKRDTDWNFGQLRRDLRELNLTEAQFDALYRVQREHRERQEELSRLQRAGEMQRGGESNPWQELETWREEEFKRVLGPNGYAEYQKLQDNRYKQLKQFAPAWNLSKDDVEYVYQALKEFRESSQDYQKRAREISARGESIDWNEIQLNLEEFKTEVRDELVRQLGEERYNKLRRAGLLSELQDR